MNILTIDAGTTNTRTLLWRAGAVVAQAQLETGVDEKAITVPQVGVTRNQKGQATALILNKENKVEQRVLTTSGTVGNDWLVTSGLAAGDRVIVEGLQKVKPGAPAVAVPAKAEAAPAPAAAASAASAH